jgi:hypothetical protein
MSSILLANAARSNLNLIETAVAQQNGPAPSVEAGALFFLCDTVAALFEAFWQHLQAGLQQGAEVRGLAQACQTGIEAADHGLLVFAHVRKFVQDRVASECGHAHELGDLSTAVQRVTRVRTDLQSFLDWLSSPRPPVEEALLRSFPGSDTDYEKLGPVIERLRAGGEL